MAMFQPWWILVGLAVMAVSAVAVAWRPVWRRWQQSRFEQARREFHRQREWLEAKFFELASQSGKPRGLRWTDCDFDNSVAYARNRQTGELCAFVGVTIAFEAIEGGGMEDVQAVTNLRAATAVFRLGRRGRGREIRWQTDGRAIFNLNPTEAIAYYQGHLVMVGQEVAHRS